VTISDSILATLAYHDIFNYPLNAKEIHKYLVKRKSSTIEIERNLKKLLISKKIILKNNLYSLSASNSLARTRNIRKKISIEKLKKAKRFARLLNIIPSIKLVAITGALAMENSQEQDDIDLMIITKSGKLWTSRLLANFILLPNKRTPNKGNAKDKACLNIFLDESHLKIYAKNIYTAHEICQIIPLVNKENIYQKFIHTNSWVLKYLPNWNLTELNKKVKKNKIGIIKTSIIEKSFKSLQLRYMKTKITTEKIGKKQLFFHPRDTENEILTKYKKKLDILNISYT